MKTRGFVITNWNLDTDYQALIDSKQVRFIAYGEETCPKTGRLHHQAFMYCVNEKSTSKRNLNKMGNMFGKIHCNVEPMEGSFAENEAYCSKEGQLQKFGNEPAQGMRGDLIEIKDKIMDGSLQADDIALGDPKMYHMYGRTLRDIEAIALRKKYRTWMTEGLWIYGPPGTGKSHFAFSDYSAETHYIKNLNEDWWDGYKGQPIVVLNEFRGQVKLSEMLDLVDKWPKTVKWRCRESVPFLATKVIVTSIFKPEEIFNFQASREPWGQFVRRFEVKHIDELYDRDADEEDELYNIMYNGSSD